MNIAKSKFRIILLLATFPSLLISIICPIFPKSNIDASKEAYTNISIYLDELASLKVKK